MTVKFFASDATRLETSVAMAGNERSGLSLRSVNLNFITIQIFDAKFDY